MDCKTGNFIVILHIINFSKMNFIEQGRKEGLEHSLEQGAEKAKREAICAVADAFSVGELSERFAMAKEEVLQILTEEGIAPKPEG